MTRFLDFEGVFIPGGHGAMVDLADSVDVGRVLRFDARRGQAIAALCHGRRHCCPLRRSTVVDVRWLPDDRVQPTRKRTRPRRGRSHALVRGGSAENRGAISTTATRPGCPVWSSTGTVDYRGRTTGSAEAGRWAPRGSGWGRDPLSARGLAEEFFARMEAGDVDEILGMMTPRPPRPWFLLTGMARWRPTVRLICVSCPGPSPTCWVRVRRLFVTGDNTAVAEITVDGTQADAFLAVANTEKHVDLDQALMLTVTPDDRISAVIACWTRTSSIAASASTRLDKITITAG